jgi:hypothetical protein
VWQAHRRGRSKTSTLATNPVTDMCKAMSMTGMPSKTDVTGIRGELWVLLFKTKNRYQTYKSGEKDVISLYALPTAHAREPFQSYDVSDGNGGTKQEHEATAWGNFVRWEVGASGTPCGKPVKPKLVSGSTQVVMEARKNEAAYNKAYYHDL